MHNRFDPIKNINNVKNKIKIMPGKFGVCVCNVICREYNFKCICLPISFGIGKYKYYIDIYFLWFNGLILLFTLIKPWYEDGISNVKKSEEKNH